METKAIKEIIKNKNKVIFSPEPEALHYIWLDKDRKIIFSSDNTDYLMSNKLEKVIETLYKKFKIVIFKINLHVHSGEKHDKDIACEIPEEDKEKTSEIIKFIMDNFYKNKKWGYKAE